MFNETKIKQLREQTPGCIDRIHLNNAGAGLMPKVVSDTITEYIKLEAEIGGYEAADLRHNEIREFYTELGKLLNSDSKNLACTANATDSFARAMTSIPFKEGDIILTTQDDYISNQLLFLSFQKRFKIQLMYAPDSEMGGVDLAGMYEMIKKHNPKLVSVSHIPTNSGLVQPVKEIGAMKNDHDFFYIVDACQSVGQMNVDVEEINCDFLTATCRKFLRGPRGAGFLYASDNILNSNLEPLCIDMQGATWIEKGIYEPVKTGQRFEDWEFAYALVVGSKAAFKYATDLGLNEIELRTFTLAHYTREQLKEIDGISVLDKGPKLCGIVTLEVPGINPQELKLKLRDQRINTSISDRSYAVIDFDNKGVAWALRVSPHYYNTYHEIDSFISALKKVLGKS